MATGNRKRFLHICTRCCQEYWARARLRKTGLCYDCLHKKGMSDIDRFWTFVDTNKACECHDWDNRCWAWIGPKHCEHYGLFFVDNRNALAHRWLHQFQHGPLPQTTYVLHQPPCLLRHCVRHLYAGSPQENTRDLIKMGHLLIGERHPNAKLTTAQVIAIREAHYAGQTIYFLAQQYQMNRRSISDIVNRRTWGHVSY